MSGLSSEIEDRKRSRLAAIQIELCVMGKEGYTDCGGGRACILRMLVKKYPYLIILTPSCGYACACIQWC
jgi:hypothetical protein